MDATSVAGAIPEKVDRLDSFDGFKLMCDRSTSLCTSPNSQIAWKPSRTGGPADTASLLTTDHLSASRGDGLVRVLPAVESFETVAQERLASRGQTRRMNHEIHIGASNNDDQGCYGR